MNYELWIPSKVIKSADGRMTILNSLPSLAIPRESAAEIMLYRDPSRVERARGVRRYHYPDGTMLAVWSCARGLLDQQRRSIVDTLNALQGTHTPYDSCWTTAALFAELVATGAVCPIPHAGHSMAMGRAQ